MPRFNSKRITVSAILIAISAVIYIVCGFIPFLNFSFGGTITIASLLPIIIISYMYGVKWGLLASLTYSILRVLLSIMQGGAVYTLFLPDSDFTVFKALIIIFLDYIAAYTVLFVGGFFSKIKSKSAALVIGSIVALVCSYICHVVSGAIFYGSWAEWFFTDTDFANLAISQSILNTFTGNSLALVYSLVYNACYMIPEIIITVICAVAVSKISQIKKA